MRFLVVDDSPTMRGIVNKALGKVGYTSVIEAQDGKDALAKLQVEDVDFIITDWDMPTMNGLQLTKAVRCNARLKSLPILMVTTRNGRMDVLEALQANINHYITKPFTPQILKEKIDRILDTAEQGNRFLPSG